jgi:hypothetical protein
VLVGYQDFINKNEEFVDLMQHMIDGVDPLRIVVLKWHCNDSYSQEQESVSLGQTEYCLGSDYAYRGSGFGYLEECLRRPELRRLKAA